MRLDGDNTNKGFTYHIYIFYEIDLGFRDAEGFPPVLSSVKTPPALCDNWKNYFLNKHLLVKTPTRAVLVMLFCAYEA